MLLRLMHYCHFMEIAVIYMPRNCCVCCMHIEDTCNHINNYTYRMNKSIKIEEPSSFDGFDDILNRCDRNDSPADLP